MTTPAHSLTGLAGAAADWLETLTADQRAAAGWPFEAVERGNWHYAPRRRNGVPLRAMKGPQQDAAQLLLARTLSAQGLVKARAIMALERVLAELEPARRHVRDPLDYAFTIFGDPGHPPWGWRIEGHHLIVNVTVAGSGALAVTPSFWGARPAGVRHRELAGRRVLSGEYDLALDLARSLSPDQRRQAIFASHSVGNIISERGRGRALRHPTGLVCSQLGEAQRGVLTALLEEFVGNMPDGVAAPYRRLVRHDLASLHLAWAGGMAHGEPFYYRLHGPRILVEFDCTADGADHIHSVWRDPAADWGRDILGDHYRDQHDED